MNADAGTSTPEHTITPAPQQVSAEQRAREEELVTRVVESFAGASDARTQALNCWPVRRQSLTRPWSSAATSSGLIDMK